MDAEVAVVGDGPAGSALAGACARAGLSTLLVGPAAPWTATYGTWRDDVADLLPDEVFAAITPRMVAIGHREHVLDRAYGVLEADRLRDHLTAGVERVTATVTSVTHHRRHSTAMLSAGGHVQAALVVDATGRGWHRDPVGPLAWQTAFGVVLDELPAPFVRDGAGTLMDWRPLDGARDVGVPTFGYVVPVADGWLVEETVLAASPAVPPEQLEARLVARLGPDGAARRASARRTESVRIAMGVGPPAATSADVRFGAAAGYVHPATGYSVAASLRAAPRVARAVAAAVAAGLRGQELASAAHRAVWPLPARRARALHDFGLAALTRLDGPGLQSFFDAFFELPVARWRDYLRVDATPGAVAGVMTDVFRAAPAPVRRRLATGDPRALVRALAR